MAAQVKQLVHSWKHFRVDRIYVQILIQTITFNFYYFNEIRLFPSWLWLNTNRRWSEEIFQFNDN